MVRRAHGVGSSWEKGGDSTVNLLDIQKLSKRYAVRKLTPADAEMIYSFCKKNTQYYEYCGKQLTLKLIGQDLRIVPPGFPPAQKYYVGFFDNAELVAVMDLLAGYPTDEYAYIGFFMMARDRQGKGVGSLIVDETFAYLHGRGFRKCRLGIDKANPQSNHFWKKNGFKVIKEVQLQEGTVLVAERSL